MNNVKYRVIAILAAVALAAGCKSSTSPNNSGNSSSVGANNNVFDALYIGDKLYIAGNFDTINGNSIQGAAVWDGSKWSNIGASLPIFDAGTIHALSTDGTNLYVAGSFKSTIGNTYMADVAEWNGTAWLSMPDTYGSVSRIAFGGGSLYAIDENWFELFEGGVWVSYPDIFSYNDTATSISVANESLLAAFNARLPQESSDGFRLWKYNGIPPSGTWTPQGGAFTSSGPLGPNVKLAVYGSDTYAVGDFSAVGSTQLTSYGVAKWDGNQWASVGTLSGANKVTAVAVDPSGNVYIGEPNALLEYNGTNWTTVATTAGGFGNAGTIRTIAVTANHLAIGGDFTTVNGATTNYVSILR